MQYFVGGLQGISFWVPIVSTVAAWCALLITWRNSRIASRSLKLAEMQEQRRRPNLTSYLADGYCKSKTGSRLFAFLVSLSNPSDINNSIVQVELAVAYTTAKGICMTVKIPHNAGLVNQFDTQIKAIEPPVRIDAHQSIACAALFEIDNQLIQDGTIDIFTLLFQDSHGETLRLEKVILREVVNEKATSNN